MANGGVTVPIEFVADFNKALAQVADFGNQANNKLEGIGSKLILPNLAAAAELAEIAFHAVEKLADSFTECIKEAAEADKVVSLLNQTLKASGDYSTQNVKAFEDLAEQLSKTSRFDDDLILSQVRLAKQFNTTNTEAAKLIRAAVDLAAATGEDLPTAVQQLGQTLDGTVGRVGQLIPSLQTLTAEQLRAGAAIDLVAKRFAGFAQADLNTFSGAVGEVSKAFKELQKAFGSAFVDNAAVVGVIKAISQTLFEFVEFVKQNKQALVDFVTSGIKFVVDSFGILSQVVIICYRQFEIFKAQVVAAAGGLAALRQAASDPIGAFRTLQQVTKNYSDDMDEIGRKSEQFDRVTQAAADLSVRIQKVQEQNVKLAETTEDVAKGFDNQTTAFKRFDLSIIEKIKTLTEELKNIGVDKTATITNQYNTQVKLIEDAFKYGVIKDKQRLDLENKLRLKYNQEYFDALQQKIQQVYQNPASIFTGDEKNPKGKLGLSEKTQTGLAAGLGVAGNVLQGAQGASALLGSISSTIGTALLGPVGSLLGPLIQQLAKGPDAVKQMVDEFAKALPDLVTNLIKAVPVFITELVRQIPVIIQGFIDDLPDIIVAIVEAVPEIISAFVESVPKIIESLVTKLPGALVNAIGRLLTDAANGFIGKILSGAGQFVLKILEGAAQFIKEIIEGITQGIGSKNGLFGTGFLNLSGGGFGLGGDKGLLGGGIISGILRQAPEPASSGVSSQQSGRSSELHVNLNLGHNQLAKAIVDVKRLGYRLEPI